MLSGKYFTSGLWFCFFITVPVFFSSCTNPVPSYLSVLDKSPATSASVENLHFDELTAPANIAFEINSELPALMLETGKSFVKAFALPDTEKPLSIRLRSYLVGSFDLSRTYILAPSVLLLDKEFRTVRSVDEGTFEYAVPSITETTGYRAMLEGYIFIEDKEPRVKYLLVYTKHSKLGQNVKLYMMKTVPLWLGVGSVAVPLGKEAIFIPASPIGKLRIILQ